MMVIISVTYYAEDTNISVLKVVCILNFRKPEKIKQVAEISTFCVGKMDFVL